MAEIQVGERIEREIIVPASPEETWRAVTDADQVTEWLAEEASFDLRPGGELAVRFEGDLREGFFEEVEEESRIVFWWGEPGEELTRVEIDLAEVDDGTRVRVVEVRPLVTVDAFGTGIESDFGGTAPQMSAALSLVA
jgi:uncharacterized protein YndB with AHSA1/START domain